MSLFGSNLNAILGDFTRIIEKLDNHATLKASEVTIKAGEIAKLTEELNVADTERNSAEKIAAKVRDLINA